MNEDLAWMTAAALAPLLRSRQVSPVEVLAAQLQRIEAHDGHLRAFIHVEVEGATRDARHAEAELSRGHVRGPLHGVTVAHKDVLDVAGMVTTGASRALPRAPATVDSTVAARLRAAGTVVLGKLNLAELATGDVTVFGRTRNPWHADASPGASSAGSGAALAAGLVTLATGTDTGGSIRIPAAHCGVVGLRPTYGRISRAGLLPLSWSLDAVGPMARSVQDVATMLAQVTGADARDPTARDIALAGMRPPSSDQPLRGLRVGRPVRFFAEGLDPQLAAGYAQALADLAGLGATVHDVDLPAAPFASGASWVLAYAEALAVHHDRLVDQPGLLTPGLRRKLTAAGQLTAQDWITAARIREVVVAELRDAYTDVDVIATPATRTLASTACADDLAPDPLSGFVPALSSLTRPASLAGMPALALPMGWAADGTPMGLQLMADAWEDATLVQVGLAFERGTCWMRCRPADPVADGTSGLGPVHDDRAVAAAADRLVTAVRAQLDDARQLPLRFEPATRPAGMRSPLAWRPPT